MTTLGEHIIVAGAENRPLMLEKSMYDSWASCIRLFIKGKKHGRMMLDSIDNGPLVYPTIEENGQTRLKKYFELTEEQQLQDDCDVQATNIILYGLPPDVYALVNHHKVAKAIWDKVKLLMKGTELSYQERECRLYDLFDKFVKVQFNTKFLNALPPYWSKFVTDVKLAKTCNTTTYDQLTNSSSTTTYFSQSTTIFSFSSTILSSVSDKQSQAEFPQLDSGLAVSMFKQGEDSVEYVNKAMAFLSAVASRGNATNLRGTNVAGQLRIVKRYNFQGEGYMARQCTQPKRPRNIAWFKEKLMLAEAQEAG
nr:hypothetical protein [Tanacetum cinerariifolium]